MLLLGCLLIVANGALALATLHNLETAIAQRQQVSELLVALSELRARVVDVTRAYDDYLLSDDPALLTRYEATRQSVPQQLALVRALIPERARQQARLVTVVQQLEDDGAALDSAIARYHSFDRTTVLAEVQQADQRFDRMRSLISEMQSAEQYLASQERKIERNASIYAVGVVVGGTLLSLLLICSVFRIMRREARGREALVMSRSRDLAGANAALTVELAERRQAEEALRRREVLFRELAEAMPQVVFITRPDGRTEFINRRWREFTGAVQALALDFGWERFVHPDDLPQVRDRFRQALRLSALYMAEARLRGREGIYRWFLLRAIPIRDPVDGSIVRWFGTATDVDLIKQTDQALRESEERFRRIFEASPLGIMLGEGNERCIIQVNPAICSMLGRNANELLGQTLETFIHPDDRTPVMPAESPDTDWRENEKRMLRRDGSTLWTRIHVERLTPVAHGRPQLLNIVEDITRHKQAEETLRQAQRMDAVGQLTGGLAHDFNNLLGVVIGNVEFLGDAVQDNPEMAALAKEILDSALNGAELTRRLLAFGRRQQLSPSIIDLNEQVMRQMAILRRTLGETIRFETVLADDLWTTRADPSQVGDALLNLAITNQTHK